MDEHAGLHGRRMAILYGSETGNSEDLAMELGEMAERLRFRTDVDEMDKFKLKDVLAYSLVVLVTSTTGQGDMPRNARKFWRNLLRQSLNNTNCLAKVKFTMFGLGDSSYPKYNWAARKLRGRLLQLGAAEFFRTGEGDERHDDGIASIYIPWYQELRNTLLANYPLPASVQPIADDVRLPPKLVVRLATGNDHVARKASPLRVAVPIPDTHEAVVRSHHRLTPEDHSHDVRSIQLRVRPAEGEPLPVPTPGSTVTIFPKNSLEDVQALLDLMEWSAIADDPLVFASSGDTNHPPDVTKRKIYAPANPTLRELLVHSLDFTAVPKRRFFQKLAHFTADEPTKERLHEFGYITEEYLDFAVRPARTMLEVLRDLPAVKIPLQCVADIFPTIRGREYSIANGGGSRLDCAAEGSNSGDGLVIEIVVALVEYQTVIKKPRQGFCSRYLRSLQPSAGTITVGLNKVLRHSVGTRIVDPARSDCYKELLVTAATCRRPVIAVATGTGIAPVRSLLQDRDWFHQTHGGGPLGPAVLFFGCRSARADYHYGADWAALAAQGRDLCVIPAFSRDGGVADDGTPASPAVGADYDAGRNYVQHHIRRHAAGLAPLWRRNPLVLVCGNAGRMPVSVRAALRDSLVLGQVVASPEEAEAWLKDGVMCTFWQETW